MALEVHSSHEHGVKESLLNVVQERMQKAGKVSKEAEMQAQCRSGNWWAGM